MPDWYYAKAGKQHGPITAAQLKQMAQAGELVPDDLVFQEGGTQWVAASTVKGLFAGTGVRNNAARAEPDRPADDDRYPADRDDRPPPPKTGSSYFIDLLMFRRLIAPTIIMILFWVGVAAVLLQSLIGVILGLVTMVNVDGLRGLITMFLSIIYVPVGILSVRLWCEVFILFFRMNETLTDIKETLQRDQKKD